MSEPPSKKARKVGDKQAVSALCSALSHGDAVDEAYVMECMQRGDGTTRALASLLRNGTVQKAINAHLNIEMKALGKPLPPNCSNVAQLPKNFKWKLFWACVKIDTPITEEFVVSDRDITSKLNYALHCKAIAKLPDSHAHAVFEEPLAAVLIDIYKQCGNRLSKLTNATFHDVGYWSFDLGKNTLTYSPKKQTFGTQIDSATLGEAKDWKIDDPAVFDATLSSETSGASYKILAMVKKAKIELEPPVEEFANANPDAVPQVLRNLVVPPSLMPNQKSKGKADSSSANASVRAPRRPPPQPRPVITPEKMTPTK